MSAGSINVAESIVQGAGISPISENSVSGIFSLIILSTIGYFAYSAFNKRDNKIVPASDFTADTVIEGIAEFIFNLGTQVMGKENRKYIPFMACLFLFVLGSNLLGLVPGFSMPTDDVTFNIGIAVTVFILFNYWGIKEVGIKNYLKHLWGPIPLLGLLIFPIELVSLCVRPLTLSLRLFGNMFGDHTVIGVFTEITKIGIPVIFYFVGTFVCFMQAFVFTLLTMIYVKLAVAHDH